MAQTAHHSFSRVKINQRIWYLRAHSQRSKASALRQPGVEGEFRPRVSLRHSAIDQWRSKTISADRRVPSSGLIYYPSGGPRKNTVSVHDPEPQVIADAIATFQCNNRIRARLGEPERNSMTIPCITMIGTRPIFYLVPVTRVLSEAVATAQYPLSTTVVKKCVVTSNSCRLSEGMETPDFRQVALQHYTAWATQEVYPTYTRLPSQSLLPWFKVGWRELDSLQWWTIILYRWMNVLKSKCEKSTKSTSYGCKDKPQGHLK